MTPVSLDRLANEIAKPGFERELIPLLMYRGRVDLGRAHRLWNLTIGMMLHEAESISEGINHLQMNPDFSQLCFPDKRVQKCSMDGFLTRLRANPSVSDLVPGLTEYVQWIKPRFFEYQRVPLESGYSRHAWWRTYNPDLARRLRDGGVVAPHDFEQHALVETNDELTKRYGYSLAVISKWRRQTGARREVSNAVLAYPYLVHEAKRPEHELLRLVNDAIPAHLPPDVRADMCQDLAVGILIGEFARDDLYLPSKEVAKRVYRMFPTKYGPLSIDAPLSSDGDFTILDTLVDEGRDWA